jgi:hypothetical protein
MLDWRDRLPDRLPNSGGVGDRPVLTTISVDTLAAVFTGAVLTAWLLGLLVFGLSCRASGAGRHWLRLGAQVGVGGSVAAATSSLLMLSAAALDAPSAADVRLSWGYFAACMAVPMVVAGLVGLLAYSLAGRPPRAFPGGAAPIGDPAERDGAAERLLWWEFRALRPMLWLSGALALNSLVMIAVLVPLVGVIGWAGAAPAVSALVLLPFSRYRLTIDREAVRVAVGPLRRRVPMSQIVAAEEGYLPVEAWLLRSALRGATARDLPLLPGRALALRLADGTRRLITCRDVPTAVEIVNTLRSGPSTAEPA